MNAGRQILARCVIFLALLLIPGASCLQAARAARALPAPRAAWVEPEGDGARFIWEVDLLPDELAGRVEGMMNAGIEVIRKTLESTSAN